MNSSSLGRLMPQMGQERIPESVTCLFGAGRRPDGTMAFPFMGATIETMSCQVFEDVDWSKIIPQWKPPPSNGVDLRYFEFTDLMTVDNSMCGVKKGTYVQLHLFISENFQSSAMAMQPKVMSTYE